MISHLGRCDIISRQWARGRAEQVRERRHHPPGPDPARCGTAQRELRPPTAEAPALILKHSPKRGCRQAPWSLRNSPEMISHLGRCDIISRQRARGRAEHVRERVHDPPVPDPARCGAVAVSALACLSRLPLGIHPPPRAGAPHVRRSRPSVRRSSHGSRRGGSSSAESLKVCNHIRRAAGSGPLAANGSAGASPSQGGGVGAHSQTRSEAGRWGGPLVAPQLAGDDITPGQV